MKPYHIRLGAFYPYKTTLFALAASVFMLGGYLLFSHPVPPKAPTQPAYLFVQTAKAGFIQPEKTGKNRYKLTVSQVAPHMSYFTDQPFREAGAVPVNEFVANWQAGRQRSKQVEKPNVVVHAVDAKTHKRFNRIFELDHPTYDAKTQSMSYQATLLENQKAFVRPVTMGHTVIFIDDLHWHGNRFDPPHG